ncbi:tetratricopeptide repeat protein [Oceanicoccus sp. KOV_DT_Chl]|uniref:tetratricopeptide repeat protein n=1 Tax=Oceanicoccus sp. KOV_DT_Chl TaxID=1904639 RepID=UPI000C7BAE3F|nr:tetratricopeptide repeat protein [Oceanicoccus sp. KOV_DT_Chl]
MRSPSHILSTAVYAFGLTALLLINGCSDEQADSSKQAEIHLNTSASYMKQGQYRAAIIEARNVIKYAPESADGYIRLATIYNELGNTSSALDVLNSIAEKYPSETSLTLATVQNSARKFRSALNTIDTIRPNDNSIATKLIRANALLGLKDFESATAIYQQILNENADNAEAKIGLAKIAIAKNEFSNASTILDQLLSSSANNPEALFLKAQLAYYKNELENTERYLTEAIQLLPQTDMLLPLKSRILQQLSETLTQLGRPSEGLVYSRILAEANPEAQQAKSKFTEALRLYQSGELDQAEELLTTLYEEFPNNSMSGVLLGMINYQQGDMSEAEALLSQNIDAETASTQVISSTALTQIKLNKADKAVELLEDALKSHPDDSGIHTIYGLALLNLNPTDEQGALAIQKALAIEPSKARLHLILSRYYLALNKPEQAYAQLNTALTKSPQDNNIQEEYIKLLLSNKELSKAQKTADKMLVDSPDSSATMLLAAQVSLAARDLPETRQRLEQAAALDNNNLLAHLSLGQLDLAEKKLTNAATKFRQVIAADPNNISAYKGLITSFEAQGKGDAILQELNKTAKQENTNSTLPSVLAEYYGRQNNLQQAQQLIKQATATSPISEYTRSVAISLYRSLSLQNVQDENYDEARSSIFQALKLAPQEARLLTDLTNVEIAAKNYSEALKVTDQIAAADTGNPLSNFLKGQVYVAQQHWDDAIKFFQLSWNTQPNDTTASSLYRTLQRRGDKAAAADFVTEWQQKLPNSSRAKVLKAIEFQSANQKNAAIELYEQALELAPTDSLALNNLAWLYFEKSDPKATTLAEKAYKVSPESAGVLDTYGWILAQNGDVKKGISLLEKAAEKAPNNKEIQQHLEAAKNM